MKINAVIHGRNTKYTNSDYCKSYFRSFCIIMHQLECLTFELLSLKVQNTLSKFISVLIFGKVMQFFFIIIADWH